MDARMFAWADELLRHFGNTAVHGTSEIERHDARTVLELTKAIVLNVYVLDSLFQELRSRLDEQTNSS